MNEKQHGFGWWILTPSLSLGVFAIVANLLVMERGHPMASVLSGLFTASSVFLALMVRWRYFPSARMRRQTWLRARNDRDRVVGIVVAGFFVLVLVLITIGIVNPGALKPIH